MSEQAMYRVIGADGNTYGPVDFETLRAWAADNRLKPESQVINESTGVQSQARFIAGLFDRAETGAPRMQEPVSEDVPRKKTSTWMVVLAICAFGCCGCGVLGAAILFPVFSQARQAAQRTVGLSNLKQLSLVPLIYAADYDDYFPPHMESAVALQPHVFQYSKNPQVFRSANPRGGEILGDGRLSKRNQADLLNPAEAIMFYDSNPWSNGEGLAAYTDGHAKVERPFSAIKTKLQAKIFTAKKT